MKLSNLLPLGLAAIASASDLDLRANCNDNCGRQIIATHYGTAGAALRSGDCLGVVSDITTVTVTPTATAEETACTDEPQELFLTTSIPVYASACTNPGAYASACSCLLGHSIYAITKSTVTVTAGAVSASATSSTAIYWNTTATIAQSASTSASTGIYWNTTVTAAQASSTGIYWRTTGTTAQTTSTSASTVLYWNTTTSTTETDSFTTSTTQTDKFTTSTTEIDKFTTSTTEVDSFTPATTTQPPATSTSTCSPTHPVLASPTGAVPQFGGVLPASNNDGFFKISLPFPIKIYNVSSTDVFMATNGFLFLQNPADPPVIPDTSIYETANSSVLGYDNVPLPTEGCPYQNGSYPCTSALPYYALAAFWDDLLLLKNTKQGLFYEVVLLTTPETQRSAIFEWYATHEDYQDLTYHFTVQFFEDHPDWITVTYYQVALQGAGGTVGVQGGPEGEFAQFSYNSPVITRGLMLDYNPASNAWQVSYKDVC